MFKAGISDFVQIDPNELKVGDEIWLPCWCDNQFHKIEAISKPPYLGSSMFVYPPKNKKCMTVVRISLINKAFIKRRI